MDRTPFRHDLLQSLRRVLFQTTDGLPVEGLRDPALVRAVLGRILDHSGPVPPAVLDYVEMLIEEFCP